VADKGTDSFVGVVLGLTVAVALFAAATGNPLTSGSSSPRPTARSSSTTRSTATPASRTATNIPGSTLARCSGEVISNETVARGGSTLNLKVYYRSGNGGRNCAVATKVGDTARRQGPVLINLRFTGSDSRDWPQFAEQRSAATAGRSGSIYLDRTDDRCVRAEARFTPTGRDAVTVTSGRTGCD